MHKRLVLWVLASLLIHPMSLQAQVNEPRLYRPTPEDYLRAWVYIAPQMDNYYAITAMAAEMRYHYPDAFDYPDRISDQSHQWFFDQYLTFFNPSLADLYADYRSIDWKWQPNNLQEMWDKEIILKWIAEYSIDLNSATSHTFEDYDITITPRDFDADGQNEWLFYLDSSLTRGYMVLKQYTGELAWVMTALPFASDYASFYSDRSGIFEELGFEDINADGLPEWMVAYGGYGIAPGMHLVQGQLFIMTWKKDHLSLIGWAQYTEGAGGGRWALPRDTRWEFVNLDDDPALEFLSLPNCNIPADCEGRAPVIADWDGEYYRSEEEGESTPPPPTPSPTGKPLPTMTPNASAQAADLFWSLPFRLNEDNLDLEELLSEIETALTAYNGSDEDIAKGLRYWRAFLLDELGREAEATEGYLSLWEQGWHMTPWSTLAGLHLKGESAG